MTDVSLNEEVWISCPITLSKKERWLMSGLLRNLNKICAAHNMSFFGYFEGWHDDLRDDDITEEVLKIGAQMD